MNKSRRLMWNIFAFLIGFCALLITILWIFETTLLDKMYKNIRRNEIEQAINLVADNINNEDLDQILLSLRDNSEIIVTPAQSFVFPKRNRMQKNHDLRQVMTEKRTFTNSKGEQKEYIFYAIISPVKATVSTIKVQLYYVTGIMVFLSVILAFIIARSVAKPIENLNNSAKKLATGNYDIKFVGRGYREIHELSDTLNYTTSELSKVESLRRELMANISHDLRTPLALIYSYAEMMNDFPGEINKEQTEVIMNETKRLTSLVGDIFDVSQLEAGTLKLNKQEYNITKSISETIKRVSELVKKDGYKLVFENDGYVSVVADEVKITQAFYNLLINAIHYCGDDLTVVVRQRISDKIIRVEVEDHGPGIDEEDIENIWNRYYKIDKTHKRAIIGTGLGLSIVKKIIEMHGGACGVDSQTGEGSIFWFTIPIK